MNSTPAIAVHIATCNNAATIADCLCALQQQTIRHLVETRKVLEPAVAAARDLMYQRVLERSLLTYE